MSLLMDALKQAEQGRDKDRKADEPQPPDTAAPPPDPPARMEPPAAQTSGLSLEPAEPAAPPETGLDAPGIDMPTPEPPLEGDDERVTHTPPAQQEAEAPPAPAPARPDGVEPEQGEARGVDRAARLLATKRNRDRRLQRRWIVGGGLVLSVMVVAVTVYGFVLQSHAPGEMMLGMSEPIEPVAELASGTDTSSGEPAAAAGEGVQTVPASAQPADVAATPVPPGEAEPSGDGTAAGVPASRASQSAVSAPDSPASGAVATAGGPTPAIRIRRTQRPSELNAGLQTAYRAYRSGDYVAAGRTYDRILAGQPRQRDALLGRAAVALQQGDRDTALRHYDTLLRLDPTDAAAHAALAGLRNQSPRALESRLQELLYAQPRAVHLHFALANLYADQQRWAEAQQAYFQAHRYAPDNADYAYNLAVALDRLDQGRPALEYYRKALTLSGTQAVQFDPVRLRARIATLAGQQAENPA